MSREETQQRIVSYYDAHPINETQILNTLQSKGIALETLTEEILQAYDQDHYGGVEAIDFLVQKAGIQASSLVLDVCCGIGGPARYLAHRYGCRVTGLDLTESRIGTAVRFSKLVKLDHLLEFRQGDALNMPFADGSFDVVIGQEAWVHIPDKVQLISECVRVVRTGGAIAFTDILLRAPFTDTEAEKLRRGMSFRVFGSIEGYRKLLTVAGCAVLDLDDLSEEWTKLLTERLQMYRGLKEQTIAKFGEDHYNDWDDNYSFFVGLFITGKLGGGRFIARRHA